MAARLKNVRVKDGKIQVVHKLDASKRIAVRKKTERQMKAWVKKSK